MIFYETRGSQILLMFGKVFCHMLLFQMHFINDSNSPGKGSMAYDVHYLSFAGQFQHESALWPSDGDTLLIAEPCFTERYACQSYSINRAALLHLASFDNHFICMLKSHLHRHSGYLRLMTDGPLSDVFFQQVASFTFILEFHTWSCSP